MYYSKTCLQGTLRWGDTFSEQCRIFPMLRNLWWRDTCPVGTLSLGYWGVPWRQVLLYVKCWFMTIDKHNALQSQSLLSGTYMCALRLFHLLTWGKSKYLCTPNHMFKFVLSLDPIFLSLMASSNNLIIYFPVCLLPTSWFFQILTTLNISMWIIIKWFTSVLFASSGDDKLMSRGISLNSLGDHQGVKGFNSRD